MKRLLAVLLLSVLAVAGCSTSETPAADTAAYTAIIDVRTPAEFATEHVVDAVNIDVQSADFAQQIAQLDPNGSYLLYCRSGNRSAAAAAQMSGAGLTVTDGGGLGDMKGAGWTFTS